MLLLANWHCTPLLLLFLRSKAEILTFEKEHLLNQIHVSLKVLSKSDNESKRVSNRM